MTDGKSGMYFTTSKKVVRKKQHQKQKEDDRIRSAYGWHQFSDIEGLPPCKMLCFSTSDIREHGRKLLENSVEQAKLWDFIHNYLSKIYHGHLIIIFRFHF
ncbi:MAG: hypothetical protein Ct9H300mP23_10040 [Nitrospinota bacterium]|nr:MAG: hypothetical protein Ct9H300mP23_10040 [Nitrospinota bacterium]